MGQDKASFCETVMYGYNREQDGKLLHVAKTVTRVAEEQL